MQLLDADKTTTDGPYTTLKTRLEKLGWKLKLADLLTIQTHKQEINIMREDWQTIGPTLLTLIHQQLWYQDRTQRLDLQYNQDTNYATRYS